jgi:hypothetical protein
MDGRNAGSAVIGFVNGMYILKFHSDTYFLLKTKNKIKNTNTKKKKKNNRLE